MSGKYKYCLLDEWYVQVLLTDINIGSMVFRVAKANSDTSIPRDGGKKGVSYNNNLKLAKLLSISLVRGRVRLGRDKGDG